MILGCLNSLFYVMPDRIGQASHYTVAHNQSQGPRMGSGYLVKLQSWQSCWPASYDWNQWNDRWKNEDASCCVVVCGWSRYWRSWLPRASWTVFGLSTWRTQPTWVTQPSYNSSDSEVGVSRDSMLPVNHALPNSSSSTLFHTWSASSESSKNIEERWLK